MKTHTPFHKNHSSPWVIGGIGIFITFGITDRARAEEPVNSSTNAAASSAPNATPQNSAPTPTAPTPVKPGAIRSTTTSNSDVGGLSIDDLLNITVTSAEDKNQKLSDVASALTVITSDDIERSGATNIPDLLRYVPGVEVGSGNNTDTSVTIRGFGGIYDNKLLVLVDGRSIYDPNFGGVAWEFQRMMMEDIDRVEVIRGPGSTVWGANAVNGVINIITKDSADTQGGLLSTIYGTKEEGTAAFRYGLQPAEGLTLRLYGEYENVAASSPLPGYQKYDDGHTDEGGFRSDYRPDSDNHFRFSGDVMSGRAGDAEFFGGVLLPPALDQTRDDENANFSWEHTFAADNQLTLQSYYERYSQGSDPQNIFVRTTVQIADVQARHTLPVNLLPIKQELTYGIEYREVSHKLGSARLASYAVTGRGDQTFSAFAQTDLHLIDDVLTLTAGTKYDHNDYTGNEVQPSARLLWKIDSKNSLWAAVSRSVREPAMAEEFIIPGQIIGNQNLKSEVVKSCEFGYRVEPAPWLSADISFFYTKDDNLVELFVPPGSFIPTIQQFQKAQTYGLEPTFSAQIEPWWKLTGSYSMLSFHADNSKVPPGYVLAVPALEDIDPANEFSIRSSFDLPNNIDLDVGGRFVDRIAGANGYFVADVRVAWKPTRNWEISVVGQNLLEANHVENPSEFGNTSYVGPEVYGKVTFKF